MYTKYIPNRDKTEVKNHYYTMQRRLINLIPLGSQAAYAREIQYPEREIYFAQTLLQILMNHENENQEQQGRVIDRYLLERLRERSIT